MSIPNFTLRYSKKAKYLQLRFCKLKGLQVVLPVHLDISHSAIERFIKDKKEWIDKVTLNAPSLQKAAELPTSIHLAALGEVWHVSYQQSVSTNITLLENNFELILRGNMKAHTECVLLLQKWLKNKALLYLAVELKRLSLQTGLGYARVTIRNNQTRFGSCSTKKHISLCCKLLFLPPRLVHHVMLHELCHTIHMNHGKLFWKLLNEFDVNTKLHKKELKEKALQIPQWAAR
jgi:predicted metal-dependent hydrolase